MSKISPVKQTQYFSNRQKTIKCHSCDLLSRLKLNIAIILKTLLKAFTFIWEIGTNFSKNKLFPELTNQLVFPANHFDLILGNYSKKKLVFLLYWYLYSFVFVTYLISCFTTKVGIHYFLITSIKISLLQGKWASKI